MLPRSIATRFIANLAYRQNSRLSRYPPLKIPRYTAKLSYRHPPQVFRHKGRKTNSRTHVNNNTYDGYESRTHVNNNTYDGYESRTHFNDNIYDMYESRTHVNDNTYDGYESRTHVSGHRLVVRCRRILILGHI